MEITRIKIYPIDKDKVKAYADVIFDNCFVVKGIKLIYGERYFISMPSRERKDGSHTDIAFPINSETRKKIELKVLAEYEKELKTPRSNNRRY